MKVYLAKKSEIKDIWYIVDAKDKILGRMATEIAKILRGKNKPTFTPGVDTGGHVIVINASAVRTTGNKLKDKVYTRYSGYPAGIKALTLEMLLKKKPEAVVRHAVWGMIPHNRLGRVIFRKLKVYPGAEHPHKAQNPIQVNLN